MPLHCAMEEADLAASSFYSTGSCSSAKIGTSSRTKHCLPSAGFLSHIGMAESACDAAEVLGFLGSNSPMQVTYSHPDIGPEGALYQGFNFGIEQGGNSVHP